MIKINHWTTSNVHQNILRKRMDADSENILKSRMIKKQIAVVTVVLIKDLVAADTKCVRISKWSVSYLSSAHWGCSAIHHSSFKIQHFARSFHTSFHAY